MVSGRKPEGGDDAQSRGGGSWRSRHRNGSAAQHSHARARAVALIVGKSEGGHAASSQPSRTRDPSDPASARRTQSILRIAPGTPTRWQQHRSGPGQSWHRQYRECSSAAPDLLSEGTKSAGLGAPSAAAHGLPCMIAQQPRSATRILSANRPSTIRTPSSRPEDHSTQLQMLFDAAQSPHESITSSEGGLRVPSYLCMVTLLAS